MSHPPIHSITELHRLQDQARLDAERLRREALQDFWRGTDHLVLGAIDRARRSATRLAHRLARHRPAGGGRGCGAEA